MLHIVLNRTKDIQLVSLNIFTAKKQTKAKTKYILFWCFGGKGGGRNDFFLSFINVHCISMNVIRTSQVKWTMVVIAFSNSVLTSFSRLFSLWLRELI